MVVLNFYMNPASLRAAYSRRPKSKTLAEHLLSTAYLCKLRENRVLPVEIPPVTSISPVLGSYCMTSECS